MHHRVYLRVTAPSSRVYYVRILLSTFLFALSGATSADGPKPSTSDGSVEISLKLLPSAPEPANNPQALPNHRLEGSAPAKSPSPQIRIALLDATTETENADGECPGGDVDNNEVGKLLPLQPGDIPLVQEEQPFDLPAVKATNPERRLVETLIREPSTEIYSTEGVDLYHRIDELLDYYRNNPENIARRGPWALMHAILPFGVNAEVVAGNRQVNAIGWLCHNGIAARQRMFQPTRTGFRPNTGPGVQGHDGQFLAILAQSHVQPDYPLQVGNRKFTIMDLVRYEQATCREKSELTFKLIAFSHYLPPNQIWRDDRGRKWSIEKLVAEELAQPITGAACGGTHRLMGLSCSVIRRQQAGQPITGHFARAQQFLDEFVVYTLSLQNSDGSFSTEWFERRADEPNVERKVQTTGHILEWLVYTLPDEHLRMPEITKSVNFLLDNLGEQPTNDWPIGPRGHSLRALALYQQRALRDRQTHGGIALELSDTAPRR